MCNARLRSPERRALLEDALLRGTRVHWYDLEPAGWMRLPGSAEILFVTRTEVYAAFRRLLVVGLEDRERRADADLAKFLDGDVHHHMSTAAGLARWYGRELDDERLTALGDRLAGACQRLRVEMGWRHTDDPLRLAQSHVEFRLGDTGEVQRRVITPWETLRDE